MRSHAMVMLSERYATLRPTVYEEFSHSERLPIREAIGDEDRSRRLPTPTFGERAEQGTDVKKSPLTFVFFGVS